MTEAHRAVGVAFPPLETRRDVVVDSAVRAEELGYDAFFVAEGWGLDALVLLAEIATKTERIALGTCVLSVWSRSGGTLAMAAATLSQISGSRFTLGLGASTPQLVEGFHDVAFASPVDQMRRVVTQVRELLAGNRVPLSRTDQARPLRLGASAEPVPIFLAGLAPASARLSGEIADGWMPTFVPVSRTDQMLRVLEQGTKVRSQEGPCRFCPAITTAVAADDARARELAAWWLGFYLTSMGPIYPRMLEWLGLGAEVKALQAANPTRSAFTVPPEASVLLDDIVIFGTPEAARDRLARWYEVGADLPILCLPPNLPRDEIDVALCALAPGSAPDSKPGKTIEP
jgi:alkanesulfonate monooxygenase SsuD/methylene tetrahydromethanopterin reductase-like flavin-dependent oxidoreductase (luciferase family)